MLATGAAIGRYVIDAKLGQGGMAAVYRGHHARLGSVHAIKILLPEIARVADLRARFLNEGRIQAQLRHPHLVAVTDLLEEGELVGLVMDFVEGVDFEGLLTAAPPPTLPDVAELFLQMLDALAYVHSNGVVHRDLKPQNVLIDRPGGRLRARIADFGIAKIHDPTQPALTQAGMTMGTPYFMSPEQVRGEHVTGSSDLFSTGVMLYRAVTGSLPFTGKSQWEIQAAIVKGHYVAPEELRTDLPPAISEVIRRAMAPTPAGRYETATEFARALKDASGAASTNPPAIVSRPGFKASTPAPRRELTIDDEREPDPIDASLAFPKSRAVPIAIAIVVALGAAAAFFATRPKSVPTPALIDVDAVVRDTRRTDPKTGIELIRLPGGPFLRGCEPKDTQCWPDEKASPASVEGFWIMRTEVPVDAWTKCAATKACSKKAKNVVNEAGAKCNWGANRGDHPMNCVTYDEANAFCDWMGGRLPTATEWEYAAKSGRANIYPWGQTPATKEQAQFVDSGEGTAPVASHPQGTTVWGLADMAGNLWEWTLDEFHKKKEARGGSWKSKDRWLRASNRFAVEPELRSDTVGFRCVVETAQER